MRVGDTDYISLTDLAKYTNPERPANVIIHWLSNKNTFNYLGLWEKINNPNFNFTGFREIKINEAPYNRFTMTPKRWKDNFCAIGIKPSAGKYFIKI